MLNPKSNVVVIGHKDPRLYAGEVVKLYNFYNEVILKYIERDELKVQELVSWFRGLGCRKIETLEPRSRVVKKQTLKFNGEAGQTGVLIYYPESNKFRFINPPSLEKQEKLKEEVKKEVVTEATVLDRFVKLSKRSW